MGSVSVPVAHSPAHPGSHGTINPALWIGRSELRNRYTNGSGLAWDRRYGGGFPECLGYSGFTLRGSAPGLLFGSGERSLFIGWRAEGL